MAFAPRCSQLSRSPSGARARKRACGAASPRHSARAMLKPVPLALPARAAGLPTLGRRELLGAIAGLLSGCRRGEPKPLPSFGKLGAFSLTDQRGRSFSSNTLQGRPWLAAFMFTRCPTVCPRITALMKAVQAGARARSLPLQLVSFSIDPEHDTPEVLQRYATDNQLGENWTLVTGDSQQVAKTAEERFKIGVSGVPTAGAEHFGMSHGSHLVLVDEAGTIRGYFRSSDEGASEAVLAALAQLTAAS